MTANDLIDFETDIAELFNAAKIRAPVHLYYGQRGADDRGLPGRPPGGLGLLLVAEPLPVPAQGRAAREQVHGRDPRRPLDLAVLPEAPRRLLGDRRRHSADRGGHRAGDQAPRRGRRACTASWAT